MSKNTAQKSRRTRARRSEVIAAATKLFHEKGYDATSVQDIADELGLLKGSVYYYMNAKEDLLFEIIRDGHRHLVENLGGVTEREDLSVTEQLREFMFQHATYVAANLPMVGIFFNDFRSLREDHRHEIIDARNAYEGRIRALLVRGQEQGVFRTDFDPTIISMGIFGMTNWLYQWFRASGPKSASEVAAQLATLGMYGVIDAQAPGTNNLPAPAAQ